MGSRKTGGGVENVYKAAELWVERALRTDDSLFTPGVPIWSRRWLRELRERFLDKHEEWRGTSFFEKLEPLLSGSPPEIYQLMGEVLYASYLIVWKGRRSQANKQQRINQVLGWSPTPVSIPEDMIDALTPGIADPGSFFVANFGIHPGHIVEFAEQWKERDASELGRLLADPWRFKAVALNVPYRSTVLHSNPNSPIAQKQALLHLVFPDIFEGIVNSEYKHKAAETFAYLVTEPTDDVDRKIRQVRQGIEAELGRDFDFFDRDIQARWDSSFNLWDEFITRAKAMVDAGIIEIEGENEYKSDIGKKLAESRDAVLKGSPEWPQLLRVGLSHIHHPLPWRASGRFRDWINESPDHALDVLQAFWAEGDFSVTDRIRSFSSVLPRDVATRPGIFTNLASVLLMGLNAERYPPFKIRAFGEAYQRTGYEMPDRGADEAALYEHALRFLDQLIEEASERELSLRHRLDAQTIAYRTIVASPGEEDDPPETEDTLPIERTKIDLPTLANELRLDAKFLQDIQTLLEDKKQVIFQGPPGTGKTYVAQKLAEHLAGSDERVTLVQFHPSYAYEDFVQGFRPALVNGQPGFELRKGPLLRAAKRAQEDEHAKHFLVIDEINRGNLAKVFGELYFLLEYRDSEMDLQYSHGSEKFSLPENLYIIGTMNTADRSIALVDLALRRRFYFVEFHPDEEPVKGVLRRWLLDKSPDMEWVADVVEQANEHLREDRHAAIGPSYFMKENLDEDMVERIWKHSVLPYIEERLYGQQEEVEKFKLDSLKAEIV